LTSIFFFFFFSPPLLHVSPPPPPADQTQWRWDYWFDNNNQLADRGKQL
jgi:hypothetical protein